MPFSEGGGPHQNAGYSYLFDLFSEDELKETYFYLYRSIECIISSIETESKKKITRDFFYLNENLLEQLILDTYADLHRLMKFHNINNVNCIKRASYLSYWFYRRKPVQIVKNIDEQFLKDNYRVLSVNESIAKNIAVSVPFSSLTNVGSQKTEETATFGKNFQYYFTYRNATPQAIELTLLALSCSDEVNVTK